MSKKNIINRKILLRNFPQQNLNFAKSQFVVEPKHLVEFGVLTNLDTSNNILARLKTLKLVENVDFYPVLNVKLRVKAELNIKKFIN